MNKTFPQVEVNGKAAARTDVLPGEEVAACPPCGPGWWRCPSAVFQFCDCIPRSLCRDRVQHCSDWSDEYSCPGP